VNDHVDAAVRDPLPDLRADGLHVVRHDGAGRQAVSRLPDASRQHVARTVVGQRSRVGDREDRDADGNEGAGFINARHDNEIAQAAPGVNLLESMFMKGSARRACISSAVNAAGR
jgi:hypothetical protein